MSGAAVMPLESAFEAANAFLNRPPGAAPAGSAGAKPPPGAPPPPPGYTLDKTTPLPPGVPPPPPGYSLDKAPGGGAPLVSPDWLRRNEKGEPTDWAREEELIARAATAPGWWPRLKAEAQATWNFSNPVNQARLAFDVAQSWLGHRVQQMHAENLQAAAAGRPLPHGEVAEWLANAGRTMAKYDVEASRPQNLAIGGAFMLAPEVMGPAVGTYAAVQAYKNRQGLEDWLEHGAADPDKLENFLAASSGVVGAMAGTVDAYANGHPAQAVNFGRRLLGFKESPAQLDVTPAAAETQPAKAVSNRQVLRQAVDEGVRLTPSEASNLPLARGVRGLGERSILGQDQLIEAENAERALHMRAVADFADELDPKELGVTRQAVGEAAQREARVALDVAKENAGQAYDEAAEKQVNMAGSLEPLRGFVDSRLNVRQPAAAVARPEYQAPEVRAALSDVAAQADEAGADPSLQSMRNLRSYFYDRSHDYAGNVPNAARGVYAQAEGIVDDQLMARARGTPFEEPFRRASFQWARIKSAFDQPGTPLYRILQQGDPQRVGQELMSRRSPTDVQALKQAGMEGTIEAMRRQAVIDIANGGFQVNRNGLAGYGDPFLRELFTPTAKEARNPLWARAPDDPSVRYGSFDDAGLRQAFGIPQDVNLSRLANQGQLIRTPEGRWVVPESYRPNASLTGPRAAALQKLYVMGEIGRRMRFEINPSGTSNVLLVNEQVGDLTKPQRLVPTALAARMSMPRAPASFLPEGEGMEGPLAAPGAAPRAAAPAGRSPLRRLLGGEGGFLQVGGGASLTPTARLAINRMEPGQNYMITPAGRVLGERYPGMTHQEILDAAGAGGENDMLRAGGVRVLMRPNHIGVSVGSTDPRAVSLARQAIEESPTDNASFEFFSGRRGPGNFYATGTVKSVIGQMNSWQQLLSNAPQPPLPDVARLGKSALSRLLRGPEPGGAPPALTRADERGSVPLGGRISLGPVTGVQRAHGVESRDVLRDGEPVAQIKLGDTSGKDIWVTWLGKHTPGDFGVEVKRSNVTNSLGPVAIRQVIREIQRLYPGKTIRYNREGGLVGENIGRRAASIEP